MPTYSENIESLRSKSRFSTSQAMGIETQAARERGQAGIDHARKIAKGLEPFSDHLREWKRLDIKHQEKLGRADLRRHEKERRAELYEAETKLSRIKQDIDDNKLHKEFETLEEQHKAYVRLKGEVLRLKGISAYPEAARIEGMSPHRQVGYAKAKIESMKERWPEQIQFWLQNSREEVDIRTKDGNYITVVPAQVWQNPDEHELLGYLLDYGEEHLREKLNLNQYSEEFLNETKMNEMIEKTHDLKLSHARQQFVLQNSAQVKAQSRQQWKQSKKQAGDFEALILSLKYTADENGQLLGNSGALEIAFGELAQEGIANNNTGVVEHYGGMVIPRQFASELGVKYGTTYGEKWPTRFRNLRSDIMTGYTKAVKEELAYNKAYGDDLYNKFIGEQRQYAANGQDMPTDRVNWYKDQFGEAGLTIPEGISDWETKSMRDARKDTDFINSLKASQGGVITNQQLDQFNPAAAEPFRKEADAYEKGLLEDYNTENLIKAALDTTFTGMGLKGNEKNRIYQEAFKNAKIDYIKQYNKLRAMGFDEAHANYLALNGAPNEAKDNEGQPIVGFHGVLHEIENRGEGSKYVITGQNVQNSLGDAFVRVGYVNTAKKQIQKSPNSVTTGLLGGQYGQDQLNIISANIEKYGLDRGLNMSPEAVEFYRGIANGTDLKSTGGWMGILDAQLKANIPGHEGLWPKGDKPTAVTLLTGVDGDGVNIPDPNGSKALTDQAMRAIANASSYIEFTYAVNLLKDAGYDMSSIFDNPENLINYLGE